MTVLNILLKYTLKILRSVRNTFTKLSVTQVMMISVVTETLHLPEGEP